MECNYENEAAAQQRFHQLVGAEPELSSNVRPGCAAAAAVPARESLGEIAAAEQMKLSASNRKLLQEATGIVKVQIEQHMGQ